MATSESLAIVPRFLRTGLERALLRVVRRLPPRVQRLSTDAVVSLMQRWPALSRLLRVAPGDLGARARNGSGNGRSQRGPIIDAGEGERAPVTTDAEPMPSPADAEATLIAALRDPSAEVAAIAADALRAHPSSATVAALTAAVENHDGYLSPVTRAAAIKTLAALLPVGQGGVIAAAVGAVDAEVSLSAIAALVERDDPTSIDTLIGVLETRSGFYLPLTRQAAARGLLHLEAPPDARLRRLFDAEGDEEVRESLVPLFPWITPP